MKSGCPRLACDRLCTCLSPSPSLAPSSLFQTSLLSPFAIKPYSQPVDPPGTAFPSEQADLSWGRPQEATGQGSPAVPGSEMVQASRPAQGRFRRGTQEGGGRHSPTWQEGSAGGHLVASGLGGAGAPLLQRRQVLLQLVWRAGATQTLQEPRRECKVPREVERRREGGSRTKSPSQECAGPG